MLSSYQVRLAELKQRFAKMNLLSDPNHLNAFAFFSANVTHFLPTIPYEQHGPLFKAGCFNRYWNGLDQSYFTPEYPLTVHGWDQDRIRQLRDRPGIICTFHAGAYRLINFLLVKEGLSLALLVGDRVRDREQQSFQDLYQRVRAAAQGANKFNVLSADEPGVVLKMRRYLKEGAGLLTYIDGHQGTHGFHPKNSLQIEFLGQHQWVRKGIPYMAYKFDVPIYPVFCFRESDGSQRMVWLDTIEKKDMALADFTEFALRKIFDGFGAYLHHYPDQWQNWSSLHLYTDPNRFFRLQQTSPDQTVERLTPKDYGLLRIQNHPYLLHKHPYRALKIDKTLFQKLYQNWYGDV